MLNMKASESEIYFKEVESKLLEETDYLKEIQQSDFIVKSCQHLLNLKFPRYYQELSNQKVITMDWMEGLHLSEFVKVNHDKNLSNIISQALWDFYMFQIHHLKQFHADPHPGNFLISTDHQLIAIDFGCIKSSDGTTVFIVMNLLDTEQASFLADFKRGSSIVLRINESHCEDDYYKFSMANSTKALEFMSLGLK